jgi:hypothetical protein
MKEIVARPIVQIDYSVLNVAHPLHEHRLVTSMRGQVFHDLPERRSFERGPG